MATPIKEIFNGIARSSEVQSVVIVGHGGMQADILHRQQEVVSLTARGWDEYETSKPVFTVTHFLQQEHTYSKATPPNSATPFQTTTPCNPSRNLMTQVSSSEPTVERENSKVNLWPHHAHWDPGPCACMLAHTHK